MSHSIELQPAVGTPPTISPAATSVANGTQQGQKIRPALTGDPLFYSAEELLARGYPPRPDPTQAPDAYAAWLKAVSKPSTLITPRIVTTDRAHGPVTYFSGGPTTVSQTSNNWSGFVLQPGPTPYNMVFGDWIVPAVAGEQNTATYSSLWIGLDGWGSNGCNSNCNVDVVQAGTEQDIFSYSINGFKWQIANYYAWYEWFTNSTPLEQLIQNFPVHPGDEVLSIVWVGSSISANAYGGTGFFSLEDISGGFHVQVAQPFTSKPGGDIFLGNNAEWIMERTLQYPCGTCTPYLPDLSNYGTAVMFGAYAQRQDGALVKYSEVNNDLLTMTNYPPWDVFVPDQLSTVVSTGPTSMRFTWLGFH